MKNNKIINMMMHSLSVMNDHANKNRDPWFNII